MWKNCEEKWEENCEEALIGLSSHNIWAIGRENKLSLDEFVVV